MEINKRGFTFFFILFLGLGFCGSEDKEDYLGISFYIEGIPISGLILTDEIREVSLLGLALRELGLTISNRAIIFVRDPYSEIPKVCRGEGCDSNCAYRWIELPGVLRVPPTTPSEGYKGFCGSRYIFISRLPSAYEYLRSLLIHEFSHSLGLSHGDSMKVVEDIIEEKIAEIEERN